MEELKMKTKIEIIDEVVAYYSEDLTRRSRVAPTVLYAPNDPGYYCKYATADGTDRHCAVGRYLDYTNPKLKIGPFGVEYVGYSTERKTVCTTRLEGQGARRIFEELGFDMLKPEYRVEDAFFWGSLQRLHDTCAFWDIKAGKGLSEEGATRVRKMKETYAEPEKNIPVSKPVP
jgi:hypothetical protein